jgi:hypothetical protein
MVSYNTALMCFDCSFAAPCLFSYTVMLPSLFSALPSANMEIVDAGIFWPLEADPDFKLVGLFPFPSSDHKMVWVDLTI